MDINIYKFYCSVQKKMKKKRAEAPIVKNIDF